MQLDLETSRLIMRPMQLSDAAEMVALNRDPDVIRFTGDRAFADITEAEKLILNYDQYDRYNMGRLNMFLKSTGDYIGWCGLKYHPDTNETDVGYRLKKCYWGQGYATESARASLAFGFSVLHLEEIIGHAAKENTASINVLKKIGLKYVRDIDLDNEPCVLYKIIKKEWK